MWVSGLSFKNMVRSLVITDLIAQVFQTSSTWRRPMTLCFSAALETPLCLPEEDEDGCGDIPTTPKPGRVYVLAMM